MAGIWIASIPGKECLSQAVRQAGQRQAPSPTAAPHPETTRPTSHARLPHSWQTEEGRPMWGPGISSLSTL